MQLKFAALAAAAACSLALPAQAGLYTFTGDTTGGPTYNRPFEDLSGLSAVGVDVHYADFTFTVDTSGTYSFLTTGSFDTFITIYSGSFNPASPLVNALGASDDLVSFTTSGFAGPLISGTHYVLVTTGFAPEDFGSFSTTIGGPGTVSPVPEPASYALLGLGVLAIAGRRLQAARRAA